MIFDCTVRLIFPAEADECGFPGDVYPMRAPVVECIMLYGVRLELCNASSGAFGRLYIPLRSCRYGKCGSAETFPIKDVMDRIVYGCVIEYSGGGEVYRMKAARVRRLEAPGGGILDHIEVELE